LPDTDRAAFLKSGFFHLATFQPSCIPFFSSKGKHDKEGIKMEAGRSGLQKRAAPFRQFQHCGKLFSLSLRYASVLRTGSARFHGSIHRNKDRPPKTSERHPPRRRSGFLFGSVQNARVRFRSAQGCCSFLHRSQELYSFLAARAGVSTLRRHKRLSLYTSRFFPMVECGAVDSI